MKKLLVNPKGDLKQFQKCSTKGLREGKYERHKGWFEKGTICQLNISEGGFGKNVEVALLKG